MIRRPPRSTLFPTRRSSDLDVERDVVVAGSQCLCIGTDLVCYIATGGDVANKIGTDRKSTRLNSSHRTISYAVFCLKKKKKNIVDIIDHMHYHADHEFGLFA